MVDQRPTSILSNLENRTRFYRPINVKNNWIEQRRTFCIQGTIEYRSDDVTKKLFLDFSVLDTMFRWSMMKNIHSPNWVGIGSWGPEIWPHEYLISPIESVEIGLVPNSYESGQFTLISMGYKLGIHGAISRATMNQFMSNLVCEGFSSCTTEILS